MAALVRSTCRKLLHKLKYNGFFYSTSTAEIPASVSNSESHEASPDVPNNKSPEALNEDKAKKSDFAALAEYRFVYPEFLPNPQMDRRHNVREQLERMDMLKRRSVLEIPEFYVGSILAVTVADPNAPGKTSRFVGICILREGHGLRANFILRNVIDHQGVEILYDLYNPTIQKIEVLKLEKRLDFHLVYLRDALPEYSTFPFDMEQETRLQGMKVPVNPLKVKLKPPPWNAHWEWYGLKGIEDFGLTEKEYEKAKTFEKPWEKYDLMKEYREHITEEDQAEIWSEVHDHHVLMQKKQSKERRKRSLMKAKKD